MTVTGPPAADRAYQHTKQQILSGGLAGGQLFGEAVVAADLGISRTPVHEAFLRLDAEKTPGDGQPSRPGPRPALTPR